MIICLLNECDILCCSAPGRADLVQLHALDGVQLEVKVLFVINDFSKKCGIPRYDRGADGELKLASFCSSWGTDSAPERLGFVHLHAFGVRLVAPARIRTTDIVITATCHLSVNSYLVSN